MGNPSRMAIGFLAMAGAVGLFILLMIAITDASNREYAVQVSILGGFGVLALATFAGGMLGGSSAQPPAYRPPVYPGPGGYPPQPGQPGQPGQPQPGYQPQPGQAPPGRR
jgi:hypothetical protein